MEIKTPYVSTSCQYCIFKKVDKNGWQTNCNFTENRLSKFQKNGAILKAQISEDNKGYFIIEGRLCTACRDHDWGLKYSEKDWKTIVWKSIKIPIDIIIETKETDEIPDILKIFDCAAEQSIKPKSITILVKNEVIIPDLIEYLKDVVNIKWQIETLELKDVLKYCKGVYICLFNSASKTNPIFIEEINNIINIEMIKFSILYVNKGNDGIVFQNIGLIPEDIVQKAKQGNMSYMVLERSDIANAIR